MSEEEIIKSLNNIIKHVEELQNIEDSEEREIEMSCYIEDIPHIEIKGILDLYNKQKQQIKSLERENAFLKQIYSRTEEFKSIERLANNE